MTVKMYSPRWLLLVGLNLLGLLLSEVIHLASAGHPNSVMPPYKSLGTKEALQRRLLKGREVIPSMNSNALPGEPSCEELRAMWRYYKRQSRAELTNEIPRFGSNPFWDILPVAPPLPQISSFAPVKGRSRGRLRMKNQKSPPFGRMVFKQEKERDRSRKPRPMEEVKVAMGKVTSGEGGDGRGKLEAEPIVHLSPPPTPTKASSFQQIKEVFQEERIREKGPTMRNNDDNGKAFGRIILSPPRGMDGRVANKPRELMTPFEKIRFGHADDILDDGTKPNLNLMAKRRTMPLLALKSSHQFPQQYFIPRHPTRGGHFYPIQEDRDSIMQWGEDQFVDDPTFKTEPQASSTNLNDGQGTWIDDAMSTNYGWGLHPQLNEGSNRFLTGRENNRGTLFGRVQSSPLLQNNAFPIQSYQDLPISVDNPTCLEIEGQSCNVNVDCSCTGFGLYRCYMNQCQVISLSPAANVVEEDDSSLWHTQPLQKNKLGVWERTDGDDINTNLRIDETFNSNSEETTTGKKLEHSSNSEENKMANPNPNNDKKSRK